jgi:hypothetical protein
MKNLSLFALSLIFLIKSNSVLAQNIVFDGGTMTVASGASIVASGDLNISGTSGTFTSLGTVVAKGNVTNTFNFGASNAGNWVLDGAAAQTIGGTSPIPVNNITFNNANGFTVNNKIVVNGAATFTAGVVNVPSNANPVEFAAAATVATPSNTSHINGFAVTKKTGGVFTFPIGSASVYQPVGVNLSVNSNGFEAKYFDTTPAGTVPTTLSDIPTEYWDLKPVGAGTATGKVTIYWDGVGSTTPIATRAVAHVVGGAFINEGNTAVTGTTAAGSVTSGDVSTWSPFTSAFAVSGPLPITLISFTGKNVGDVNELNWKTSSEIDASHFEIERSNNASVFEKIGKVSANNQALEKTSYDFTDLIPTEGQNYYRLMLVDLNGKFSYSKVITLENNTEKGAISNFYPNPAVTNESNIDITAKVAGEWLVTNTDITGKIISTKKYSLLAGKNSLKLTDVQKGETLFIFESKGKSVVRKLIK